MEIFTPGRRAVLFFKVVVPETITISILLFMGILYFAESTVIELTSIFTLLSDALPDIVYDILSVFGSYFFVICPPSSTLNRLSGPNN